MSRTHVFTQNTLFIEYFFQNEFSVLEVKDTSRTYIIKETFLLGKGNKERKFPLETEIRSLYLLCTTI